MIAVIYSGSRYADWKLSEKGQLISEFKTTGINPLTSDEKAIGLLLHKNNQLINYAERIRKIYFFGAGASSAERKKIISNAFGRFFRFARIVVENELQAAAIATIGDKPCLIGVLASGSNAGYFNGRRVKENNYGLGFVLADEGSANWLGRQLLKHYLNGNLPEALKLKFIRKYNTDRKQILDKVYRNPQPALYLSSFADFLMDNRNEEYVKNLAMSGFETFFDKYILPLSGKHRDVPLNFSGSVATGFEDFLKETAEKKGLNIQNIIKDPVYNVLNYYTNKN